MINDRVISYYPDPTKYLQAKEKKYAQIIAQADENAAASDSIPASVETEQAPAAENLPTVQYYRHHGRVRECVKNLVLVGATVFACWLLFRRR